MRSLKFFLFLVFTFCNLGAHAAVDGKPVIGINMVVKGEDGDPESYFSVSSTYPDAVTNAGGLPVLLPPVESTEDIERMADLVDGFIFVGGPDINPARYGEEYHETAVPIHPRRENFDFALMEKALETGKPVLGVCLGMQMLNVTHGGAMIQDIPSQTDSTINHRPGSEGNPDAHDVVLEPGSKIADILGTERISANSYHHQACFVRSDKLTVTAHAPDGIIESIQVNDHPFALGVQWHPEKMPENETHQRIFKSFIEAAKQAQRHQLEMQLSKSTREKASEIPVCPRCDKKLPGVYDYCPYDASPLRPKTRKISQAPKNELPQRITKLQHLSSVYTFDGTERDGLGNGLPFCLHNVSYQGDAIYLNGDYSGQRATVDVPDMDRASFAVAVDYCFLDPGERRPYNKQNILTGGTSHRWFGLDFDRKGFLEVTLNNQEFRHPFEITPDHNEWHTIVCSVDLDSNVVRTCLDGKMLPEIQLPDDFELRVLQEEEGFDKTLTFTNYSLGTCMYGYVDNLIVFDRAISPETMLALEPAGGVISDRRLNHAGIDLVTN